MNEGGVTLMENIFTTMKPVITGLLGTVTDVISWGLQNEVVQLAFAATIVGLGVAIFRAVKDAI